MFISNPPALAGGLVFCHGNYLFHEDGQSRYFILLYHPYFYAIMSNFKILKTNLVSLLKI